MNGLKTTRALGLALLFAMGGAYAEEYIYGQELMTDQEIADYRETLQSLKTEEAREAYRMAHNERMEQRAEEKGIELPSEATAAGRRSGAPASDMMQQDHMGRSMPSQDSQD